MLIYHIFARQRRLAEILEVHYPGIGEHQNSGRKN